MRGRKSPLRWRLRRVFAAWRRAKLTCCKAATIALTDVSVGDRVLARGKPADNQGVAANLIVVMSQGDIAKKQADERADWDRRGVAGLVIRRFRGLDYD